MPRNRLSNRQAGTAWLWQEAQKNQMMTPWDMGKGQALVIVPVIYHQSVSKTVSKKAIKFKK